MAQTVPPATDSVTKYIWSFSLGDEVHGGMKARVDSEAILRRSGGWRSFDTSMTGPKLARPARLARAILWLLRQPRDSIFFLQYPIHGGRAQLLIARILFHRFRVVTLLHDFDQLRDRVPLPPQRLLAKSKFLVSTGHLAEQIPELSGIPTSVLEVWDYLLAPGFTPGGWDPAGPILFAGSLWPGKVEWLYRTEAPRPPLQLRGRGYVASRDPGFGDTLGAPFDPENPVFDPVGWGLVWDGPKLGSEGTETDYERINQPHKVSLYLACGLPLIVWSEGYAAKWVEKNGCGITTPSLAALPELLAKVTPAEHQAMRERSRACGEKVRTGQYLLEALARLGL